MHVVTHQVSHQCQYAQLQVMVQPPLASLLDLHMGQCSDSEGSVAPGISGSGSP